MSGSVEIARLMAKVALTLVPRHAAAASSSWPSAGRSADSCPCGGPSRCTGYGIPGTLSSACAKRCCSRCLGSSWEEKEKEAVLENICKSGRTLEDRK